MELENHADSLQLFGCVYCLQSFTSKGDLVKHKNENHYERESPEIKRSITVDKTSSGNYKAHGTKIKIINSQQKEAVAQHHVLRPRRNQIIAKKKGLQHRERLVCPICSKSLWSRASLIDHQRLHTGDKPFSCSKCKCRFYSRKALLKHKVPDTSGSFLCRPVTKKKHAKYLINSQSTRGIEKENNMSSVQSSPTKKTQSAHLHTISPALSTTLTRTNSAALATDLKEFISDSQRVRNIEPSTPTSARGIEKHWLPCFVCGKTLGSAITLKFHVMRFHKDAYHQQLQFRPMLTTCATIVKPKTKHLTKLKHEKSTTTSAIRCPRCPKYFKRKEYLREHLRIHTGEKPVKCLGCGERFRTNAIKWLHKKAGCPNSNKLENLTCSVDLSKFCMNSTDGGACLSSPEAEAVRIQKPKPVCVELLEETEVAENKSIKYTKCGFCEKTVRKTSLEDHIRWHTGEKPFECRVCRKAYSSQSSLRKHMVFGKCKVQLQAAAADMKQMPTIELEKPKVCKVQAKIADYFKPQNLSPQKMSTVITVKTSSTSTSLDFICPYCSRKLTTSRNLVEHIRIHTGEKPFQCSECNRKFRTQRILAEHQHWKCDMETTDEDTEVKKLDVSKQNFKSKTRTTIEERSAKKNKKTATAAADINKPPQKECPFCTSIYSNSVDLLEHIRITHVEV